MDPIRPANICNFSDPTPRAIVAIRNIHESKNAKAELTLIGVIVHNS